MGGIARQIAARSTVSLAQAWDRHLDDATATYLSREHGMYNFCWCVRACVSGRRAVTTSCSNNCHSYVARALNNMHYARRQAWNMFILGALVFFKAPFVRCVIASQARARARRVTLLR